MKYSKSYSPKVVELDGIKINYVVNYRRVKYVRLEFKGLKLFLTVPIGFKNFDKLFEERKKWVLRKYDFIKHVLENNKQFLNKFLFFGEPVNEIKYNGSSLSLENFESKKAKNFLKKILKEEIKKIIEEYSPILNFRYRKIFIRSQKTKWASYSTEGNLSFNIKLIALPKELLRYVVFHEMTHSIEKNHTRRFYEIVGELFPNYREIERKLREYWYLLQENLYFREFD